MLELKKVLKDWTDRDITMFEVGIAMSLIEQNAEFSTEKGVVLTNNNVSKATSEILMSLKENGFVEFDKETDQFRWINQ